MKKVSLIISAIVITAMTLSFSGGGASNEVTIGTQIWMTENLNVNKFRNGDPIPEAKTKKEWEKAGNNKQPAWSYYKNDPDNCAKYGKLYNWYAVNDSRGLAPVGYHIPSVAEWTKLNDFLGGAEVAGTKMKSKTGWQDNGNGTNESGFSGLPGGTRDGFGKFDNIGSDGYWWSSKEDFSRPGGLNAYYRGLSYLNGNLIKYYSGNQGRGFSVRCLKD